QRKQFRPLTTNSKHGGRIAPDLVQRKLLGQCGGRVFL
ncbi:hypothetical protein LEP1GSC081_1095, partial [Leptospira kirschneri str. H1]